MTVGLEVPGVRTATNTKRLVAVATRLLDEGFRRLYRVAKRDSSPLLPELLRDYRAYFAWFQELRIAAKDGALPGAWAAQYRDWAANYERWHGRINAGRDAAAFGVNPAAVRPPDHEGLDGWLQNLPGRITAFGSGAIAAAVVVAGLLLLREAKRGSRAY